MVGSILGKHQCFDTLRKIHFVKTHLGGDVDTYVSHIFDIFEKTYCVSSRNYRTLDLVELQMSAV